MKIGVWIAIALMVTVPIAMFLLQRWRQKVAESKGLVVYATVVSMEPVRVFGKPSEMMKITMWVQEPDKEPREVTLRSRVATGQTIEAGTKLCVVIDPKNPKRIYPASEDAMKRVVLTGPRRERRMMQSGRGVQQPGSGGPRIGGQRRGGRRGAA